MISSIVYIIFAVIIIFFLMPAISIIYHLSKFGIKKDFSKIMATVFLVVSLILIAISIYFVLTIDWNETIEISNSWLK